MKIKVLTIAVLLFALQAAAQSDTTKPKYNQQGYTSQRSVPIDSSKQRDVIDIINIIRHKTASLENNKKARRLNFALIPTVGYTLSTGFAIVLSGNVAFYTDPKHQENLSSIESDLVFDTKAQQLSITRAEIWAPDNEFKLVSDIRLEHFPTQTYGIGSQTTSADQLNINYNFSRLYETYYKPVGDDFYVGAGYNLDYRYGISPGTGPASTLSAIQNYGLTSTSVSSGVNLDLLFDNRRNAINPLGGSYLNLVLTQNLTFLGSNANWKMLMLDMRKYFRLSPNSNNVLAFWSLTWLTNGHAPYLDLPANGEDMYSNTGRGYAQARFRGKDMLYLESEYRFGITHNGLLGGVAFANCETFAGYPTASFQKLIPAVGTGLRIKINKHSNTNACIDYGVGTNGSHGFFVNLGEVF